MRLLLLLSALFTAIAGVAAPRAQAQPVEASALIAVSAVATRAPIAPSRFAGVAFGRVPPLQPPLPRLLGAVATRLLYAERRRE